MCKLAISWDLIWTKNGRCKFRDKLELQNVFSFPAKTLPPPHLASAPPPCRWWEGSRTWRQQMDAPARLVSTSSSFCPPEPLLSAAEVLTASSAATSRITINDTVDQSLAAFLTLTICVCAHIHTCTHTHRSFTLSHQSDDGETQTHTHTHF